MAIPTSRTRDQAEIHINVSKGIPPSDVNLMILDTKEKVRNFSRDFCSFLQSIKWFVADWFIILMRPFWGKSNAEMVRQFVKPVLEVYTDSMERGLTLLPMMPRWQSIFMVHPILILPIH